MRLSLSFASLILATSVAGVAAFVLFAAFFNSAIIGAF